ncbi:MAG: helix-turn-helix domain-containing protein [Candidatus Woesearchaeota archaeon]
MDPFDENDTQNETDVDEIETKIPIDKEVLKSISKEFDLNIYETTVWLTLLSKKVLTAAEICTLSGVPRSRTYDILESLEKKGFIMLIPGRPLKYRALNPEQVIERLKMDVYEELRQKLEILDSIKDSHFLKRLEELYNSKQEISEITKINETLSDLAIYEKIRESLKNANKSIKIALNREQIYDLMDYTGGTLYTTLKRDLDVKVIVNGSQDSVLDRFFGEKNVIYTENMKFNGIIIDDRECLFFLDKRLGIWINTEFVGNSFGKIFDFIWEKEIQKENSMIYEEK